MEITIRNVRPVTSIPITLSTADDFSKFTTVVNDTDLQFWKASENPFSATWPAIYDWNDITDYISNTTTDATKSSKMVKTQREGSLSQKPSESIVRIAITNERNQNKVEISNIAASNMQRTAPVNDIFNFPTTATAITEETNRYILNDKTTLNKPTASFNINNFGSTETVLASEEATSDQHLLALKQNFKDSLNDIQLYVYEKLNNENKLVLKDIVQRNIKIISQLIRKKLEKGLQYSESNYFGIDPIKPGRKILSGLAQVQKSFFTFPNVNDRN
ncbi:unnamed protein product [Thelazia callipaeda]|uniref:Regulatory protein zeste n=1 Tax=Thelazia callipaeda TaxID=103827 RepID=A0A0N5D3F7_THECL|nr:unnamed protein product [Thelazia callipaeda]